MHHTDDRYQKMIAILEEELVTALGCTEPIAIAYAATKAREVLGGFPDRAEIQCSGNIIKNAMGVVVPNVGGLKGIQASVISGIIGGNAKRKLEVLSEINEEHIKEITSLVESDFCKVKQLDTDEALHIIVTLYLGESCVTTEIKHAHTNIVTIIKDGEAILKNEVDSSKYLGVMTDRSVLTVEGILDFAHSVAIEDVELLISRQMEYNMAIAEEGLHGKYGVGIGKTLLNGMGDSEWTKMKSYTAAASEARMSGCILPVVTNSGSGNQGITVSVPVMVYAKNNFVSREELIRALVISNLLSIHQKTKIGRLSAFCGAVTASGAAGAAITFLKGGTREQINHTIINMLANVSGIICDGAKPSCAAKIASSLDAAFMAHLIAMKNESYEAGTGIVKDDIERTISMVGRIAHDGMVATDCEILKVMLE